jgi:hypothetical protein
VLYCIHRRDSSQLSFTNLLPVRRSWRWRRFTLAPSSAHSTSIVGTLEPPLSNVSCGQRKHEDHGLRLCTCLRTILDVALVPGRDAVS